MNPKMKSKRKRTKSLLLWSYFLSFVSSILTIITLGSPNWLGTTSGNRHFSHAGLWVFCFKELPDPRFRYPSVISGCRHIFNEELWHLREIFIPGFLQVVQTTVSISVILTTVAFLEFSCFLCRGLKMFIWVHIIAFLHAAAAFWMSIGLIVFAARGDGRDWMPDWRRNYISWAFAVGVVAAVCQCCITVVLAVYVHEQNKHQPLNEATTPDFSRREKIKRFMFDVKVHSIGQNNHHGSEKPNGIRKKPGPRRASPKRTALIPVHTDV